MTTELPSCSLSNKDLQDLLRTGGHSTSGKKSVLIQRCLEKNIPLTQAAAIPARRGTQNGSENANNGKTTFIRSTNKDNWVSNPGQGVSYIMEESKHHDGLLNAKDIFIGVHDSVKAVLDELSTQFPGAHPLALLYLKSSDKLFARVLENSNKALKARKSNPIDSSALLSALGHMIRANTIALSDSKKWNIVTGGAADSMSMKEYLRIIHNLHMTDPTLLQTKEPDGTRINPIKLQNAYVAAFNDVNDGLKCFFFGQNITIDDDMMNTTSRELKLNYIASRIDPRKGQGVATNTCADVVTSMVKSVHPEPRNKSSPEELRLGACLKAGQSTAWDRGYCKLPLITYLLQNQIGSIGILPELSRVDHPFALVSVNDVKLLDGIDFTKYPNPRVVSFPGAGMQAFYARRRDGVVAVSVINRTSAKDPGHIRFLGTGPHFDEKYDYAFVRIPEPTNRELRRNALVSCVSRNDENAKALFEYLNKNAKILTFGQKTADWYLLRRTGLTASGAGTVVKKLVRARGAFPGIAKVYWKHDAEEEIQIGTSSVTENPNVVNSLPSEIDPLVAHDMAQTVEVPINDDAQDETSDIEDQIQPSTFEDNEFSTLVEEEVESSIDDSEEEVELQPPVTNPNPNILPTAPTPLSTVDSEETESTPPPSSSNINGVPIEVFEKEVFNSWVNQQFVQSHKQTDDERCGDLIEIAAVDEAAKQPFVVGNKIYTCGLLASRRFKYCLSSPDGLFRLDKSKLNLSELIRTNPELEPCRNSTEACQLEVKCSKYFIPNPIRAKKMDIVVAGSPEYHAIPELKLPFRSQLLHQAYVGQFSWNLLAAWHPTNVSRYVLIYYPEQVLRDYESVLNDPCIKHMFDWFPSNACKNDLKDSDLCNMIPKFASVWSSMVLRSNIPLLRALYTYAINRPDNEPVEPTHTFRTKVVADYDAMKGGTDVECHAGGDANKASSNKFGLRTKLTIRTLYTPLITSIKAYSIYLFVKKTGAQNLPSSLRELRRKSRPVPVNDTLFDFGLILRECRLPFGQWSQGGGYRASVPRTPAASSVSNIVAACPDAMVTFLENRAKISKRKVCEMDYIGDSKIPVSSNAFSKTTPGETRYKANFVKSTADSVQKFMNRPKNSYRHNRLSWWMGEGMVFRLNALIAHEAVQEKDSPSRDQCFWCLKRSRSPFICIFCGELFCSMDCFSAFHVDLAGFEFETDVETDVVESFGLEPNSPSTQTEDLRVRTLSFATPRCANPSAKRQKNSTVENVPS